MTRQENFTVAMGLLAMCFGLAYVLGNPALGLPIAGVVGLVFLVAMAVKRS